MIPPKHPPSDHVRDLARRLIGTPAMGEIQEELNELDIEDARALDTLALKCDGCEWWFARVDIHDDGKNFFCTDCKREHAEDEHEKA